MRILNNTSLLVKFDECKIFSRILIINKNIKDRYVINIRILY